MKIMRRWLGCSHTSMVPEDSDELATELSARDVSCAAGSGIRLPHFPASAFCAVTVAISLKLS